MEDFKYETFISEVINPHNKEAEHHKAVVDLIYLARDYYASKTLEDTRGNPKLPSCLYDCYSSYLDDLNMRLLEERDIVRAIRCIEEMERILKTIEKCK